MSVGVYVREISVAVYVRVYDARKGKVLWEVSRNAKKNAKHSLRAHANKQELLWGGEAVGMIHDTAPRILTKAEKKNKKTLNKTIIFIQGNLKCAISE